MKIALRLNALKQRFDQRARRVAQFSDFNASVEKHLWLAVRYISRLWCGTFDRWWS